MFLGKISLWYYLPMRLTRLEINGFKSFGKKTTLSFDAPVTSIVGPNGSGKSNVAEAFRWVLGEQSLKSLRGKRGEDLIFNGTSSSGRLNRASVSVAFDNTSKRFNIDYDEVVITRTVHRDGSNEYAINGSAVRLKDIIELLGSVSLGSTGHHIISQGEADRILNSSIKDRQEMIEEALGLKVYQWKITESEKKLDKTEQNVKEIESLRREIAPHIRFLKKQVEKVEKADEMRRELKKLYFEYLKRESLYLIETANSLANKKSGPQAELTAVLARLADAEQALKRDISESAASGELAVLERMLRDIRAKKDDIARQLGRLEGLVEIKTEQLAEVKTEEDASVPMSELKSVLANIEAHIDSRAQLDNISVLRSALIEVKSLLRNFVDKFKHQIKREDNKEEVLASLKNQKVELDQELAQLIADEEKNLGRQLELKQAIEKEREATRGAEREVFELRSKKMELSSILDATEAESRTLAVLQENFKRELDEAVTLVDREVLEYDRFMASFVPDNESRDKQEDRRRTIERIKIRLEDMGMEGTDVLTEYKEVTERDEYLAKELADLLTAGESLKSVMKELREKLSHEFADGIGKINKEFNNFFVLMFDGGSASLELVQEVKRKRSVFSDDSGEEMEGEVAEGDKEVETGIDISVNLPRKKIKGLQMLSGGERALTSIALLFAMSQVNPPPFLILDETDAALDEANSRKYGEMVTALAKHSQLIVITHNRETMSRASILYGVTMGSDGVSKLLSIKFDEASGWAK